jgi:mannose-6-phosphate isomerase
MGLRFSTGENKEKVFKSVEDYLGSNGLRYVNKDDKRPWGGFFVIDEADADRFIDTYFSSIPKDDILAGKKISPKILLVEPGKRLSWQFHHRRSEIWKVIGGRAGIISSLTDHQTELQELCEGDIVELKKGERHRLVGLDSWGIIAEIWQHTDKENPSDEEDIVRVEDDFGR